MRRRRPMAVGKCFGIGTIVLACAATIALAAPPKHAGKHRIGRAIRAAKAHVAKSPTAARVTLKSILVEPSQISLTGPLAQQRLLVTGRYSDGSETDLTARATVK